MFDVTRLRRLAKTCAIVGTAESTRMGRVPEQSAMQLAADAAFNALEEAGLQKTDVDGILTASFSPAAFGEYLGIAPRFVDGTSVGGCSYIIHLSHAVAALNAGFCDVALVVHGESGYSRVGHPGIADQSATPAGQFEGPWGVRGAPSGFSIPVLQHFATYGTSKDHLAEVAVATRKWANLNPRAFMHDKTMSFEDYHNSPWIAYPFQLFDCCLVTDAGGAYIVTTAERARDLKQTPVLVLGCGEGTEHRNVSMMHDFTTSLAARRSGERAFAMAEVRHDDIDVVNLYDAFTFTPLLALEDLGFCRPGEGGPFVTNQRTAPGGDFPMNTNGGGLSYTHTGMYGMFCIMEVIRQVRHDFVGTPRQVPDVSIGLAHGPGGYFSAAGTAILARD
jgi:acetyl-CoA acetyltransferase